MVSVEETTFVIEVAPSVQLEFDLGVQGPPGKPGASGSAVSAAPGNTLEARDDGLYVPSVLASTQW